MGTKIKLRMDGKEVVGREGQTILEIARENGVPIPTLCYMKHLSPWGGCRLCIVEVGNNAKRVVPACSTPAADGSEVVANSERLRQLRRATLELLFSERNHVCPVCPYNKGDCGLQHQAYVHGIETIRFPYLYPALPVDLSAKYFGLDHNRCILCTRCVRTCEEVEGVHTLDVSHRGSHNRIVVDLGATFGTSDTCTSCGSCSAVRWPVAKLFAPPAASVLSAADYWCTLGKIASSACSAISSRPSAAAISVCAVVTKPGLSRASESSDQ
jgi:bidirectional [NiFe] hydrogenase diaphorase subunit